MLNTSDLMSGALKASQRSDFGESDFEVPLNDLVDALNQEGRLNDIGMGFHSARLTDLLSNRLRMEAGSSGTPRFSRKPLINRSS